MSATRSPVRRYVLRIVLLLILVLVAGWAAWDYAEARRSDELLAAAHAAGEPLTPLALRWSGRTTPGDAARLYLAAADLVRLDDSPEYGTIQDGLDALAARWPPRSPAEADLVAVNRALEKNRLTFEMLDTATGLEFSAFPPGTRYNYRTGQLLSVGRIAALRAAVLALGSDPDAAVSSVVSWLRMSRVFRLEPLTLLTGLRPTDVETTISVILERLHPSREALDRLEQALRECENDDQLDRYALMERASLIEYYWPRFIGSAAPRSIVIDSAADKPGLAAMLVRPVLRHQMNEFLQLFAGLVSAARTKPGLLQLARLKALTAADEKTFLAATPRDILDSYQKIAPAVLERVAVVRCARLAVAIEKFRQGHHAMPGSLAQVASDAGDALPIDPMTGDGLKLLVHPDSYVVYSIGGNGQDDGGQIDRPARAAHAASGTPKRPALDWGVRIRLQELSTTSQ